MNTKKKWLYMLLAACFMFFLQSETASAVEDSIYVNGTDILNAPNHTVACGNGTAKYDPAAKTLTLENAVIGQASAANPLISGIEIQGEGITIELIGSNTIYAHCGIQSSGALNIKGMSGGSLTLHVRQDSVLSTNSSRGIFLTNGGLTVQDAKMQIDLEHVGDAGSYAVDIWGGDGLISNSQIEITAHDSSTDPDSGTHGINLPDANTLTITGSDIVMKHVDAGIAVTEAMKVLDSRLSIQAKECSIVGGSLEVLDGSSIEASAETGVCISVNNNIIISGSSFSAESEYVNGFVCKNLEVTDASTVIAKGYYPGLFVTDRIVVRDSSVDAEATNDVGFFSQGSIEITGSQVKAPEGILANGNLSITGGTTEIGAGKIVSRQDIYIGGVVTSNGTPSYENIESGNSGIKEFARADYSKVDVAIDKAKKLKKEDYINFEIVEKAIQAVVQGKNFTEQDVVDGYAAAIDKAVSELKPVSDDKDDKKDYKIVEGADQVVMIGVPKSVTIKADGDLDKFVSVLMDGKELDSGNYTVASDSVTITFKAEYIKTLSEGIHTVTISYTDGTAETNLTVKKDKPSEGTTDKPSQSEGTSKKPSQLEETSKKSSQPQTSGQTNTDSSAPKTGDYLPIGWIIALIASAALTLIFVRHSTDKLNIR